MSRNPVRSLEWLQPRDDERNLISASVHMITITLLSMSLANLTWFIVDEDMETIYLSLGQFFWFGYTNEKLDYSEFDFINSTIVNLMRTTILISFMAIIFSLCGFFLDIIGPRVLMYRMIRRYAIPGTCTVLWIMAIVSVSYYIVLLIEDSISKITLKMDIAVTYGFGFYVLTAAGGIALVGIFYNLILAHHSTVYLRDDDHCLIDGFDDGLDTFNHPLPPPPYNIPPPPYSP